MMDKQYEPSDEEYAEPGNTIWHVSEPDGGPDVGITVGLGNGRHLWCGEITKDRWESIGGEDAGLGGDGGFWLILYGKNEVQVLGKMVNEIDHVAFFGLLSEALRATENETLPDIFAS